MEGADAQDIALETPADDVFIAPSIHEKEILLGRSYTHHSPVPKTIGVDMSIECVLGVDEAGRGPVLGPMVYGLLYLPLASHESLLAETYHFDDSKVLTPSVRSSLMQALCTQETDLYLNCGWATRVMSARDISAGMLKPAGTYNLNAQAMDATIELVKEVFAKGICVKEIYIDTIGSPSVYQQKLARIFPTTKITVAKKADSLFPCVSAASVCAKVTRDAALEVCHQHYASFSTAAAEGWGSGYPSDSKCSTWLKNNMDPLFGWGSECRFSWGTAKDLLDAKGNANRVDWPAPEDDDQAMRVTDFFVAATDDGGNDAGELAVIAVAASIFYNRRSPRNIVAALTRNSDQRRFCYFNLIERGRLPMDKGRAVDLGNQEVDEMSAAEARVCCEIRDQLIRDMHM